MQDLFTVLLSRISYGQCFVTKALYGGSHRFSRNLPPLFICSLPYLLFVFSSHNHDKSLPINLSQAR